MMTHNNDKQLIVGLRRGDTAGYKALYGAYSHRVMGFAKQLCGNRPDAEDLVQESFLAAYTSRASFNGRSRLLAWLLGICMRKWRDKNRRGRLDTISLLDDTFFEAPSSSGNHVEGTIANRLALAWALSQINEVERITVLLVISQGLTYREAATAMDEPVGTIKWRVSDALVKLQTAMTSYDCDIQTEGEKTSNDVQAIY